MSSSEDEDQPKKLVTIFTDEQVAELQESFEIFDKDADGKISVPEMLPLMGAIGIPYQESELEEFCARNDQTGSGLFNFEEFIRVAEHFREKINMEDQLLKAIQVFLFHDDDKRMTDKLLESILTRYGDPFTPEELTKLKYYIHEHDEIPDNDEFIIEDFIKRILTPWKEEEPDDD